VVNRINLEVLSQTFSSRLPADVLSQMDLGYYSELEKLLTSSPFDIVQIEHSQMAWTVPLIRSVAPGTPVVLDLHNVESRLFKRWSENDHTRHAHLLAQAQHMESWERTVWNWFDACLTVAPEETAMFRVETGNRIPTFELPTGGGMDLSRFPFTPRAEPATHDIVYVGTLGWSQNIEGLNWFIDNVFPLILVELPDARLHIAGFGLPHTELIQRIRGRPEVILLGEVPDERPLLKQGGAFIVPLFVGSGSRVKITTAWAAGIPVVATTIGAEGLHYTEGSDILIADDPRTFADSVVRLLTNNELANNLRENGRRLAHERYSSATSITAWTRYISHSSGLRLN